MNDKVIQWFPGHMTKTQRQIKNDLPNIDAVIEVIDARAPFSSKNPNLAAVIGNKPVLIVFNKSDLADDKITDLWIAHYKQQGLASVKTNCKMKSGTNSVIPAVKNLLKDKLSMYEKKGMSGRPIRLMVIGIPNSGKSSLINHLAKEKRTKVEDRPGVTRGKQWISIGGGIELLDTPGVLWPKFENQDSALKLAFTGAIKDDVLDLEWLCLNMIHFLREEYPFSLDNRYKIISANFSDDLSLFQEIGKKRGFLMSKGEINTVRTSIMLLDEFRAGLLGKISLEKPDYEADDHG